MKINLRAKTLSGFAVFLIGAIFTIALGIAPALAQGRPPLCANYKKVPEFDIKIDYGNVEYISTTGISNPVDSHTHLDLQTSASSWREGNKMCVSFEKAVVSFSLLGLKIMIDERYPKGSCAYNAIKDSNDEDIHYIRNLMRLYSVTIHDKIAYKITGLKPRLVNNKDEKIAYQKSVEEAIQAELTALNKDFEMLKNKELSRTATYERRQALLAKCKDW